MIAKTQSIAGRRSRFMGHPDLDLTGKTAVVIGGTSGIGRALAKGLAQAGANVVPTGRRTELVQAVAGEIEAIGRKALVAPSDVTDRSSVQSLLETTRRKFGSVAILVTSPGRTKPPPTLTLSHE